MPVPVSGRGRTCGDNTPARQAASTSCERNQHVGRWPVKPGASIQPHPRRQ